VRNILALARHRPHERHRVDLNQVIREAVELMAYPLRVDSVQVTLDMASDLPILWADPCQLQQVVLTLVSNAHQAMQGTPRRHLTVSTRWDASRGRVSIAVADTGPGIPPAIRPRILESFLTASPEGHGTGLGLPLCQELIEGHGGSISMESRPDQGTIFRVELPVGATPADRTGMVPAEAPPPVRDKRILVVDDESMITGVLADMLRADGHQVDSAENGAVALRKLCGQTYDLILCDIKMPEVDGPALYREIQRRCPDLVQRFIFLTGDILSREAAAFLERTGAPSLSKPFRLEELRRLTQEVLRAL
jgi:two-component system NtrC family sensor kinase